MFAVPLSFTEQKTGFGFGVPKVITSDKAIMGGAVSDVTVTVPGVRVDRRVRLRRPHRHPRAAGERRKGARPHRARPGLADGDLHGHRRRGPSVRTSSFAAGEPPTVTVAGRTYGLLLDKATASGTGISVEAGGRVTWFAVPDGGYRRGDGLGRRAGDLRAAAYAVGSRLGDHHPQLLARGRRRRRLVVACRTRRPASPTGTTCDLGTFPSVYGTLSVCRGDTLDVERARPGRSPPSWTSASSATPTRRPWPTRSARTWPRPRPYPADTYFGGKALHRSAQLYQLATQLGLEDVATPLKAKLVSQLDQWTDPQGCAKRPAFCFVYDPQGKGMIGLTASFGSDEYNDHHFHYGYFLYTAGLLAGNDPALATQVAAGHGPRRRRHRRHRDQGLFPDRRAFDAYNAHSWASGTSPFGDGNNQESTSEAVTAWTGLSIWADATKNQPLKAEATWMLAGEQATALLYGLRLDKSDPVYQGFGHQVFSLTWGGKRDYATWFSPSPAAMLAILVLPASPSPPPTSPAIPNRIRAQVAGGDRRGRVRAAVRRLPPHVRRHWPDGQDAAAALKEASSLDAKWVDDGNSRAYLLRLAHDQGVVAPPGALNGARHPFRVAGPVSSHGGLTTD